MVKRVTPPVKKSVSAKQAVAKPAIGKKKYTRGLNKKGEPSTDAKIKAFGVEKLYAMISEGISYEMIASHIAVPYSSLKYWLDSREQLVEYARAREARANYLAEECISIADKDPGITLQGSTDAGAVAHQRLRVDTRRWIASKMLPTIYGDRQILAGDPKAPLAVRHTADLSNLSDEELALLEKLTSKIGGTT